MDRTFAGKRWVNILLRTIHLIGVAGLGGAFFFDVPPAEWTPFLGTTIATGLLLMALSIWTNGIWLLQLRGVAIIVKLVLLALALASDMSAPALIAIIAVSGIIAHAPGKVRYWPVLSAPRFDR